VPSKSIPLVPALFILVGPAVPTGVLQTTITAAPAQTLAQNRIYRTNQEIDQDTEENQDLS
jgi:hypothetical protein